MRKASIVAIIVAAALMIAGGICCAVGSSAAKKEGFMLFPQTENGESVYTYDFTGRQINRISITVRSSNVKITRGGDRSYVTIKNYNANYYRLNEENKTISFAEIDDVLSMFKFWEGFSFKGMRYVFSAGIDGEHEIEINLSDSENVRAIVVSAEAGRISSKDFTTSGDLSLSMKDGEVEISGGEIENSLSVNVVSGSLKLAGVKAGTVLLNADAAETTVTATECDSLKWNGTKKSFYGEAVKAKDLTVVGADGAIILAKTASVNTQITSTGGSVSVDLPSALGNYSTEIASKTGNIFVNGELYKISCTLTSQNAKNTLKISTDSGPVELTSVKPSEDGTTASES